MKLHTARPAFAFTFSLLFAIALQAQDWPVSSKLATGVWYKIPYQETGLHQLNYGDLEALGFTRPASVAVYGFPGSDVPETVSEDLESDLVALPQYHKNNALLFFAEGLKQWKYHNQHEMFVPQGSAYSEYAYIFVRQESAAADLPQVRPKQYNGQAATRTVARYMGLAGHERNDTNLILSGRKWYGEYFGVIDSYNFAFDFPNMLTSETYQVLASVIARSPTGETYTVSDGAQQAQLTTQHVNYSHTSTFANSATRKMAFQAPAGQSISLGVGFSGNSPDAEGWLDYLVLNTPCHLRKTEGGPLLFHFQPQPGDSLVRFRIEGAPADVKVWDVSSLTGAYALSGEFTGGRYEFVADVSGGTRRFVIFSPGGSFNPLNTGHGHVAKVPAQNLHASPTPDYVLVAHPGFIEQARTLAGFHRSQQGLDVLLATTDKIYNEFSGGRPDAGGIRNMLRMFYSRVDGSKLKYLLLFGDGSYDNKRTQHDNTNFIPTYQSVNSLSPTGSFVTDDFYGLLDIGEGGADGYLDLGIGRFPVTTEEEAELLVKKTINYFNLPEQGLWQNTLVFAGDDEDGNIFMVQADQLAEKVATNYPEFLMKKIYLDAFQQETSTNNAVYPSATRELNTQVNNGALLINYTGHGGETGLAEEEFVTLADIRSWRNKDKLTVFMTATCEFSRFDDFRRTSAGEETLLNPQGGAAALFSTTRLVWAGDNHLLNKQFINYAFARDKDGRPLCLGDIMRQTKVHTGSGWESYNKRNFMLLGDPALRLNYGRQKVAVQGITRNGQPVDTLRALDEVEVSGTIVNADGEKNVQFNGEVQLALFDKPVEVTTLGNDGGNTFQYTTRSNKLYNGRASVSNGAFSIRLIIPKDIDYQNGAGKMYFYAFDTTATQNAAGGYDNFFIGGAGDNAASDNQPPEVQLFMNSTEFEPGDVVNSHPVLYALMEDNTAINTASGIGHNITLKLDDNDQQLYLLNDYYESALDNHRKGSLRYPLSGLEPGAHTATLKVWDVHNNSAEASVAFNVRESEKPYITGLYNYPNPFAGQTRFYFKHNQAQELAEIEIRIYNSYGKLVRVLQPGWSADAFYSNTLSWDGRDAQNRPLPDGFYFYRLRIRSATGEQAVKSGKALLMNTQE